MKPRPKPLFAVSSVVVLTAGLLAFPACDTIGNIDPVETVCAVCETVAESGVCDMLQSMEAEKCEPGETLVFVNLEEAVAKGESLETDCR